MPWQLLVDSLWYDYNNYVVKAALSSMDVVYPMSWDSSMENSTHFYRFFQDIYISIIFFNVFIFCFELGESLLQNSLLTNNKRIPFAFCIDALSILTSNVHRRLHFPRILVGKLLLNSLVFTFILYFSTGRTKLILNLLRHMYPFTSCRIICKVLNLEPSVFNSFI